MDETATTSATTSHQAEASVLKRRCGVDPKMIFVWAAAVAAVAFRGRYGVPLAILVLASAPLFAMHNAIYVATARVLGLRGLQAFDVWLGPTVLWCRVRGVPIRINLLPIGSYVKFPSDNNTGARGGFGSLNPLRKAALMVSAPLFFTLAGWRICGVHGLGNWPMRTGYWIASHEAWSPTAWKASLAAFLAQISSASGAVRAIGILMLINGVINLAPVPIVSGGAAARFLLEPLLGPKMTKLVLNPIGVVGMLLYAATAVMAMIIFVTVVFGLAI